MNPHRRRLLGRGLRLEAFTIGWNVVEAVVAIGAGVIAGSIALVGFGLDSVIETIAAVALYHRLSAELRGAGAERSERLERRALRVVAVTFFLLAAYIAFEAVSTLVRRHPPEASIPGVVLALLSLAIMPLLGWGKLRVGRALGSRALVADAKETFACAYLSFALLVGLALNALWGWWWADPLAALAMVPYLAHEGREAWEGAFEESE